MVLIGFGRRLGGPAAFGKSDRNNIHAHTTRSDLSDVGLVSLRDRSLQIMGPRYAATLLLGNGESNPFWTELLVFNFKTMTMVSDYLCPWIPSSLEVKRPYFDSQLSNKFI